MNSIHSQRVSFMGFQGHRLDARLEFPAEKPSAYGLFAHCFTCSKHYIAASRISHYLAEHGIAILRFDFTGLGNSEGDFANTNFSSNIEDLKRAVAFLRDHYQAPNILIGHSLGGSAVLAVAGQIPEIRLVATIAAPSDPEYIKEHLAPAIPHVEREGQVEVMLAGRRFQIQKQLLDDISSHNLRKAIRNLNAALLIFHSPGDTTVSIDNAHRIYKFADHPKSFLSLDQADHLLTRRSDAGYIAHVISAWVSHKLPKAEPVDAVQPIPTDKVIVTETGEGRFVQRVEMGPHTITADEPNSVGGEDRGASPYDLLLASLGTCTTMTLRMYAEHKKLPLEQVKATLTHEKIDVRDCEDCETESGRVDFIERTIELVGELTEAQRRRMLEIAERCPVHRSLLGEVKIVTRLD